MTSAPTPAPAQPAFGPRLVCGLSGVFIAAIMAGMNNRVASLALVDIRGAQGFGTDPASWLDTVYLIGEIAVQPFAAWFAVAPSFRPYPFALSSPPPLRARAAPPRPCRAPRVAVARAPGPHASGRFHPACQLVHRSSTRHVL